MTEQSVDQGRAGDGVREDEISILDLLVILARQKKTIVRTVMWFGIVGMLIAIFSSSEYTSNSTVIREVEDAGATSSALDALRGFGIGIGGATSGLTADAYPKIVKSREVRLAVARAELRLTGREDGRTFVDYVEAESGVVDTILEYTVGLPGKIADAIFAGADAELSVSPGILLLTKEEEAAIERLSEMLRTSEDLDSGLMTISIVSDDRFLSVHLALSFVEQLVERVRAVYTKKSRQNLDFIRERFSEAERKLAIADSSLAQFEDRNVGVTSARLDTERRRLQRQVTFKSQLYSDLQTQLTQTEIELQRAEPVITVLEKPVAASEPSGPRRLLTLVLFLILGGMVGVALAFIRTAVQNSKGDAVSRGKLDEISAAMPVWRWRRRT